MTSMEYMSILCVTVSVTYGDLHKNCTEACEEDKCLFGLCLGCKVGFYQPDCKPCPEKCLNRKCWRVDRCTNGCERGWYGNACDKVCEECPNDLCHPELGICFKTTFESPCPVGHCSESCPQNCEDEEKTETDGVFSTNGVLLAAFISLLIIMTCFCCAIKISRTSKRSKTKQVIQENTIEIIPFTQRRLAGTGGEDLSSSNRTFPHVSYNNMYLDSTYTMLPCSVPTHSETPTPGIQVTMADIPPPPREESPPPAYSSLFHSRDNSNSGTDSVPA